MNDNLTRAQVDLLCELTKKYEATKSEIESLQALMIKSAEAKLRDTKLKTITFYGTGGNSVTVSTAGTVKPVSYIMIREIFGKLAPDFLKEETKYSLTPEGKEILRIIAEGDYADPEYLREAVSDLPSETVKALMKKLTGKYEKDMKAFIKLADLSEEEASDRAYLVQEAMNGEKVLNVLSAAGTKSIEEIKPKVRSAVILDETVKVRTDYE